MAWTLHRGISTALSLALMAFAGSGCSYQVDNVQDAPPPPPQSYNPFGATIDAGETLTTNPGQGAGAFVEYQPGGTWHVFTACDTQVTGQLCQFQLNASPSAAISSISGDRLKSSDYFQRYSDGSFSFYATTGLDENGVFFTTQAGAQLNLELVLDGNVDPTYLVWYGNGTVHATPNGNGATGSPVVFQPSSP